LFADATFTTHKHNNKQNKTMSIIGNILAKFQTSAPATAPMPVAVSTQVQADNSAEVKFGFSEYGQAQYDPNQKYGDFVAGQAKIAGISLQANYTAQLIVNGQTFVVDPSKTFAELNAQYRVTPEARVTVSVPDPERPAGELG
jgi:hypothetical protein